MEERIEQHAQLGTAACTERKRGTYMKLNSVRYTLTLARSGLTRRLQAAAGVWLTRPVGPRLGVASSWPPRLSRGVSQGASREGKPMQPDAEVQLEQIKLLFDYTKFHIGLYTTVTAGYIAVMASDYGRQFFLQPSPCLVWGAVVMFMVAGLAGGIIASSCPHYPRLDSLMAARIAPYTDGKGLTGRTWTYVEHTAFWVGILLAILSVAFADSVPGSRTQS